MNFRTFLRHLGVLLFFFVFFACNNDEEPDPVLDPLEEAFENNESWFWVPKDEMLTRSGQTSGYGVNFNSSSTKLLIYLEGGGVCFNAVTCFQNPNKFDETDFQNLLASTGGQGTLGIYNRSSTQNPFDDWNYVYVPYTTGDIHSGNNPSSDVPGGLNNQVMVGFNNITEVLNDIAPFFKERGVTEVFLSGASAGGYGTLINYNQVAESFPDLNISMIADSSPIFFDTEIFPSCLNERIETTFNIQFPSDYEDFTSDNFPYRAQRIYEYLSNKYPDAQFGFYSYYEDETERYFFGFGLNDCADAVNPIDGEIFKAGLIEIASVFEDFGNWKVYYENGNKHTILFSDEFETMSVETVPFANWLSDLNQKSAASVMR